MAHLIDKDALVAEIESLRRTSFTNFDEGVNAAVQTLLEALDTLEAKEVDLQKEFDKCCENHIFDDECDVYRARHFFELGLKTQKGE